MSDNLKLTHPQDASKINVHEAYEVVYWTKKFNCTKQELIAAVTAVGVSSSAVKQHLNK